jgi:hypothetical protein
MQEESGKMLVAQGLVDRPWPCHGRQELTVSFSQVVKQGRDTKVQNETIPLAGREPEEARPIAADTRAVSE